MADRNSAGNFSNIFQLLASRLLNATEPQVCHEIKIIAKGIWKISYECDFCPEQMGCNEALIELELYDGHEKYADDCGYLR